MNIPGVSHTFQMGDGREITLETGKLAKQADGSVTVKMGNAVILATIVSSKEARPDAGFFPLSVDYQEKFAAAGRIPGGFQKREARLTDYEILISRLVDRAMRPLFPDGYMNDTQFMLSLISADPEVQPDALAALAASTAITMTDIPFSGPISEVRVIKVGSDFIVNPTTTQMQDAELDIIVAATIDNITMVEGEANECSEEDLITALNIGHDAIKIQCKAQLELAEKFGAPKEKRTVEKVDDDEELKAKVDTETRAKFLEVASAAITNKDERKEKLKAIKETFIESLGEEVEDDYIALAKTYLSSLEKEVIRTMMIEQKIRLDGRKMDEVRPIWIEVDALPSPHGSSIFTRGETQALCSVTLGTKQDEQLLDKVMGQENSDFILHYNFPGFSTGEVKPNRGPGRREVGHGNLAHRSIKNVLPPKEENPYTIRVVSDILESNGSSSMATVCGASLSLMDAGVKIKAPVSGIAMGLVTDGKGYAILSDILGDEDHLGDMDFKVTGTRKGICACQMDIKVDGLPYEVLSGALQQAKQGRLHILDKMEETIAAPRADIKPHAPRAEKLIIEGEFIGAVIGKGGETIQKIQADTNTTISINELEGKKGEVSIFAINKDDLDRAMAIVKGIITKPEAGETYENCVVKSVMPYGAFVEFLPGKQGLLHISEISGERIEKIEEHIKEGDVVTVKLLDIDQKTGKFKLSKKALLAEVQ